MVIVHTKSFMDLPELLSLVGLGPPQHLHDIHGHTRLDPILILEQELLDPDVSRANVEKLVHQRCDPLTGPQALKHLVLALLHILSSHLHPHGEPGGNVSSHGLENQDGVHDVLGLDATFLQDPLDDIQDGVKVIVRHVHPVVHGPQVVGVVGHRPSEDAPNVLGHLLLNGGNLCLVLLEETPDTRVLQRLVVHCLHHVGDSHLSSNSFIHRLG
mmetsp:Transcript_37368/g.85586  ORF Transcript_37368/g.85586 Transcript_37368/m.85586 type:complete len:214 (-) Transcript_37368:1174-1815(-)